MPNIQVKNVPDEVHAILRDRAASRHQSMQEFILETLIEVAKMRTDEEIFDELRSEMAALHGDRPPVTRQMILDALDEGRASR